MAKRSRENVSPPPSKRERLSSSQEGTPSLTLDNEIVIFSWNINGIAPFFQPSITSYFKPRQDGDGQQGVPKASLRDFLRRHEWPTLLFLQEVKISRDDTATIAAVEKAVRRQAQETSPDVHTPDYVAYFCLPRAEHLKDKIYGVCSLIRKDFLERFVENVRPVKWAVEGRVLVIETKAVDNVTKLAIFNTYLVNGTEHPYKDANGTVEGTRHDRKLQVHALLQTECRQLEDEGFGVILAGDMNIARSPIDGFPNLRTFPKQHCINRADFEARFFSEPLKKRNSGAERDMSEATQQEQDGGLGMIDTYRHIFPQKPGFTYYPRSRSFGDSCDRVDMIMISRVLKDSLQDAGMFATLAERGTSDHVPLYARLFFKQRVSDAT